MKAKSFLLVSNRTELFQNTLSSSVSTLPLGGSREARGGEGEAEEVIVQLGSPSPAYGRPSPREGDLLVKKLANKLDDLHAGLG